MKTISRFTLIFFAFLLLTHFDGLSNTKENKNNQGLPLPMGYNSLFAGSGECLQCHNSMVDMFGNNLGILSFWKSTMMANSGKDPFWRAKVSYENIKNPGLQTEIETTCTRCHAPMGNFDALHNGQTHYSLAELYNDPIAKDGVSCTACHQIKSESLGNYSGEILFGTEHKIWGPYTNVFANPMIENTGYTPIYGAHIKDSELCASCHTLFTPTVDLDGQLTGNYFTEQAVYQEWENSLSFQNGVSCQACHLPEINESIIISTMPPWLDGQTPFGKHELVGGNAFMLKLLRNNIDALELTAETTDFDATIARTLSILQERSIAVECDIQDRTTDTLFVNIQLSNLAGHKIPSGYPSRRVIVQLEVKNELDETVFYSGEWNENFELLNEDADFEQHHAIINSEEHVQIYQMVMGNVNGEVTSTLLHAAMPLKDNRLPPAGFSTSHPNYDTIKIVGSAENDANFNFNNQGGDIINFHIPTHQYPVLLTAEVRVYYQSISPRSITNLLSENRPEILKRETLYNEADKSPILMKSAQFISDALQTYEQEIHQLVAYPNPAHGWVNVQNLKDVKSIAIYNSTGSLLKTFSNNSNENMKIDLPSEKGIYFIEAQYENGESRAIKVLNY